MHARTHIIIRSTSSIQNNTYTRRAYVAEPMRTRCRQNRSRRSRHKTLKTQDTPCVCCNERSLRVRCLCVCVFVAAEAASRCTRRCFRNYVDASLCVGCECAMCSVHTNVWELLQPFWNYTNTISTVAFEHYLMCRRRCRRSTVGLTTPTRATPRYLFSVVYVAGGFENVRDVRKSRTKIRFSCSVERTSKPVGCYSLTEFQRSEWNVFNTFGDVRCTVFVCEFLCTLTLRKHSRRA